MTTNHLRQQDAQTETQADGRDRWTTPAEGFLSDLGFVGMDRLELPILCTLVTGEPLLLVGPHGTAKTALTRALAEVLDLSFQAYDASKALFEDIIGFPDPDALGSGQVDYVPTELSLWDRECVLIDEISRASPQTQSKWLEVIRSRTLMGERLPSLSYVFSAMNPPDGYSGAQPLDNALAGRFAFVLEMPGMGDLRADQQKRVFRTVGGDDAPLARERFQDSNNRNGSHTGNLPEVIAEARRRIPSVRDRHGDAVDTYLSALLREVREVEAGDELALLNGRRMGFLRRHMMTGLALTGEAPEEQPELLWTVLEQGLPHDALDRERPHALYRTAHEKGIRRIRAGETDGHVQEPSGQSIINRALDRTSPDEARPHLARMVDLFEAFGRGDVAPDVTADQMRRILHAPSTLFDRSHRSVQGAYHRLWTERSPARTLAATLFCWWVVETDYDRQLRQREDPDEALEREIEKLAGTIRKRRSRHSSRSSGPGRPS